MIAAGDRLSEIADEGRRVLPRGARQRAVIGACPSRSARCAASPTAAVVDAQTVRSGAVGFVAGHSGTPGCDPARRVVGRKRHALVGTDGRLLAAITSPVLLYDSRGGAALLQASRQPWPFLLR